MIRNSDKNNDKNNDGDMVIMITIMPIVTATKTTMTSRVKS
jgi:hypothetical protein